VEEMERKWRGNGEEMERKWRGNGEEMERKWRGNVRKCKILSKVSRSSKVELIAMSFGLCSLKSSLKQLLVSDSPPGVTRLSIFSIDNPLLLSHKSLLICISLSREEERGGGNEPHLRG
jgi:hypothetical protein